MMLLVLATSVVVVVFVAAAENSWNYFLFFLFVKITKFFEIHRLCELFFSMICHNREFTKNDVLSVDFLCWNAMNAARLNRSSFFFFIFFLVCLCTLLSCFFLFWVHSSCFNYWTMRGPSGDTSQSLKFYYYLSKK